MSCEFNINAEVKTLKEVLSSERSYVVPGYQRPYEWESEQLGKAFESIKRSFEEDEKCLFGTMQMNKDKTIPNRYEIIDGQQRLTTFALLLRALGNREAVFDPEIELEGDHREALRNADSENAEKNSVYYRNYCTLKKLAEEYEKEKKKPIKELLAEFLLERVCIVEVATEFENSSVEKTIEIFNTLNTTGLSLDMKDLFKIRFYDKVREREDNAIQRINNAYAIINEFNDANDLYNIKEDDLISAFKFWILGQKEEKEIYANDIKMSSNAFFEKVFKGDLPAGASLSDFETLAKTIRDTQITMQKLDACNNKEKLMLLCAKELLDWSGYGHLKTLFFVFVHAQTEPDMQTKVINALQLTELLWKMCSMFHAVVGQIINDVFSFVGKAFLLEVVKRQRINIDSITAAVCRYTNNYWRLKNGAFQNIINGDVFGNTRRHLFLVASYINDAERLAEPITAIDIKHEMFYYSQWSWDIEHILSQNLYSEDPICDRIGNLLYLEKSLNRKLGTKTKNLKGSTVEQRKLEDADNKEEIYRTSTLKSVKQFCLSDNAFQDIHATVEKRDTEKREWFTALYKEILCTAYD